jgi:hypothetical protein
MKTINLLLSIVFTSFNAFIQETNLSFSKVINTDSIGKDAIYAKVKEWFAINYNSAKDVIQMDDKEAGILTGKGTVEYSHGGAGYLCYDGYIDYNIKIQVKDNRLKVELTDFIHRVQIGHGEQCNLGLITTRELHSESGMSKKYNNITWNDIKSKMDAFSNNIFDSIEKKINDNNSDNW